jgi:hypothetical protein
MNERPSVIRLTAADSAWGDEGHDTPFVERQSMLLMYATSPDLVVGGPRFVFGARVGGYVVPQGDKRVAFNNGVLFHPIGFRLSHPEYTVDLGDTRGVYVGDHGVEPPEDMRWFKAGEANVAKPGYYRVNGGLPGNKVTPTITAFGLVNGFGVSFAMYRSAFNVGKDLVIRAERLRVKAEGEGGQSGELKGCVLGMFKFGSRLEKMGPHNVPLPTATLVGKLGEANGPTLEQWRLAKQLRAAFKEGGDWTPMEVIEPPAPPPEALPHRSDSGARSVVDENNPPPAVDGESDWEIDDSIEF